MVIICLKMCALILFYFTFIPDILYFILDSYAVVTPFTICQHAYQLVSLFFHRYGSFEDCEGERNQCRTGESRGAVRTWVCLYRGYLCFYICSDFRQLLCLLFHFHGSLKIEVKVCVIVCVYVSLEAIRNKRELMNDGVWLLHESQHCNWSVL